MIERMPSDGRASRARKAPAAGAFPHEGLLLFFVAFALRAAYAWVAMGPNATPSSDAASYDTVAWNLARGAGFALDGAAGPYPTAFVPPVLPFLTSLLYRVVGHQFFAALLLQCAIGALVPVLLASFARHERSPWFGCSCCPSNVSRFIPSVAQYAYAVGEGSLWVNLFLGGKGKATLDARDETDSLMDMLLAKKQIGRASCRERVSSPV